MKAYTVGPNWVLSTRNVVRNPSGRVVAHASSRAMACKIAKALNEQRNAREALATMRAITGRTK